MTTTITSPETNIRFTHKATGITWNCATERSAAAPFVLRLHNPRRRNPTTSHRFTTVSNRDKYVARYIAIVQEIDSHVAANFYPTQIGRASCRERVCLAV